MKRDDLLGWSVLLIGAALVVFVFWLLIGPWGQEGRRQMREHRIEIVREAIRRERGR